MDALHSRHSIVDERIDLLLRTLKESLPVASDPRERAALTGGRTNSRPIRGGHARKGDFEIKEITSSVQVSIAAAEYLGLDMSEAKRHLALSIRLRDNQDFEEAQLEADAAGHKAGDSISSAMPRTVRTVTESLHLLERLGLDLGKEKALLSSSVKALRKGDYKDAILGLAECRKKLREAKLRPALQALFRARNGLIAAKKAGCDVWTASALLNESVAYLRAGDTADAETFARRSLAAAKEQIELQRRAKELLRICTKHISVARGLGTNVDEACELASQSQKLLKTGNTALAAECAKKAITTSTVSMSKQSARVIDLAEENLKLARDVDICTEGAEASLKRAKDLLSKNDFASSLEMAHESLFDSNTAIAEDLKKRIKQFDQFVGEITAEIDSFKQVQDAIEHSKDRNLETIRKYTMLSEEIVGQAYENAIAYARVAQDIMGQACESTIGIGADRRPAENENASARTFSSVLGQVMAISNGDRRLRIIDAYLSGKITASDLDKLLALVDSNPAGLEIAPP